VLTPHVIAQSRLPDAARRPIEALIDEAVPGVAPAMALTIVHQGALAYEAAFGWLDPETECLPATPDTRFDLASVSKLFTATAFLSYVSQGRLQLDDAISGLIPEFVASGPRGVDGGQNPFTREMNPVPFDRADWRIAPSSVTYRHLLSHTSGLAPWRSVFEAAGPPPPPAHEPDPVAEDVRWAAGMAAVYGYAFCDRPGRAVHYSDLGYLLLGEALRRLGDRPLAETIQRRITGPLGLDSAVYSPSRAGVPRDQIAPTSFDNLWRMRRSWGEPEDENAAGMGGAAGHAGLFATARDIAAFGLAWLTRDIRLNIARPLMDEAVSEQADDAEDRRGLGWGLREKRPRSNGGTQPMDAFSRDSYGHTGFTGTSLSIDPERGLVVALLTNRVYAGRSNDAITAFRPALHRAVVEGLG